VSDSICCWDGKLPLEKSLCSSWRCWLLIKDWVLGVLAVNA